MKPIISALIISATSLGVAFLFSTPLKHYVARNDTISVTGLGEQEFDADIAHWNVSFSRKAATLQEGSTALKSDEAAIRKYLISHGIHEEMISAGAISFSKEFTNTTDTKGQTTSVFDGYTFSQTLTVSAEKPEGLDRIGTVSKSITELLWQGIELSSSTPEYLYTKLADLKINLIAKASVDAHSRAEQIAKNSGMSLDGLKSAMIGVLQITAKDSSEAYSDIGTYNTDSRKKVAAITIKTQYEMR